MKRLLVRLLPLLTAAAFLAQLAGCASRTQEIDGPALVQALLTQVTFDTPLSPAGDNAALYFPDLPQGTDVTLYSGSGYYADEVALLTVPNLSDADAAMKVLKAHAAELRNQFMNYVPEEVGKIDNAVFHQEGRYLFLCITKDYQRAQEILNHAQDPSYTVAAKPAASTSGESSAPEPPASSEPSSTAPSETPPEAYPVLTSQSGTYYSYGNGNIRVDNSAFEDYCYVDSSAAQYAALVSGVADKLAGKTKVYCLPIPTGIGIVLPDDIASQLPRHDDQGQAIRKILEKMSANVVPVDCYDNLMRHRDEYLYFRTDHHWNGLGAYYAYESFCKTKGVQAYAPEERTEKRFSPYLGSFYTQGGNDPLLGDTPDTVVAYCPVSSSATMRYTDRKGKTYDWSIVMDVSNWKVSSKYSAFAAGDNPISVFQNPEVTDGSVCVIVKESYGNALLPYLVDHYSTIYEIDYRYWSGNLVDFAGEKGAQDLIFANNLSMIRSNYLIGLLAGITG